MQAHLPLLYNNLSSAHSRQAQNTTYTLSLILQYTHLAQSEPWSGLPLDSLFFLLSFKATTSSGVWGLLNMNPSLFLSLFFGLPDTVWRIDWMYLKCLNRIILLLLTTISLVET